MQIQPSLLPAWRCLWIAALFLGAGAQAVAGSAASPASPVPAGRYTLDLNSLDGLEQAIARAAAQAGGMQRQVAQRRLRERLRPAPDVELTMTDAGWVLRLGENRFPAIQPGAAPQAWSTKEGKDAKISLRIEGDQLIHEVITGDRMRRNTFTYDETRKVLRLAVRVEGRQLRQPITYELRYQPAA